MSRFKIRDLMINVIPQESALNEDCPLNSFCPNNSCAWTIVLCPGCTYTCGGCTLRITEPCGPCTYGSTCGDIGRCTLGFSNNFRLGIQEPADLGMLKAELRRTLAQIEEQETAVESGLQPQTVEEIEALEKKLTEALQDLKVRKSQLRKKTGKKYE